MKHKHEQPVPKGTFDELPVVTIQLPLYNEMYVVDRLVDSVCLIDYPREKLEIQVLDDSTDETRQIAELAVRRHAMQGIDIKYIHREDRTGYKAGALDEGLKVARGEFVAIFDADFIPKPDFLMRSVHYFTDPQGRAGAGALGPHQRGLLAPHQDPGRAARRALRARARQPQSRRLLLQLQRHGRRVAQRRHCRRRRLAARHADRRSRPQLPHPAQGLAVRLRDAITSRRRSCRSR